MTRQFRLLCAAVVLSVAATHALRAQSGSPLVGAWERFSVINPQGTPQPQAPPSFVIFSADGYFSQTAVTVGRPKIDKPLPELTREELLARFQNAQIRRGTYRVAGDRLTRIDVVNLDPNQEGSEQTQRFRIEGDVLVLNNLDSKAEARFRRMK